MLLGLIEVGPKPKYVISTEMGWDVIAAMLHVSSRKVSVGACSYDENVCNSIN